MLKKLFIGAAMILTLSVPCFPASAVTEDDVRQWLGVWQKREGLEQLKIDLVFVEQKTLGIGVHGNPALAVVDAWSWGGATIRFAYPAALETVWSYTPERARWQAEETVIHELMHLVIRGLYAESASDPDWLMENHALDLAMENITDNLAQMLMRRGTPGGVSVARYISRQIDSGPWKPARDVRKRIMLQVAHAMNAANQDDVVVLASK